MALDEVIESVCQGSADAVRRKKQCLLAILQGSSSNKEARADVPATAVQLVVVWCSCSHRGLQWNGIWRFGC